MRRGEIWWVQRPNRKPRPHCILTRNEAIPVLTDIVVVPATSRRREIDTEVPLDSEDGMPKPCVLAMDGLTLAPKAYLTERITTLSAARLHQVCVALRIATGC